MADGDRHQRAQHGAAAALLHPARDGEQPAHGRVDAVVGAEPGQGQPRRVGASRREAVGVARGVAALQADLVRALAVELDEELRVELERAVLVASSLTIQPSIPSG